MGDLTNLNGAPVSSAKKCLLTLEYDQSTGKLALGGQMENLDLVLNVLAQATRWAETQYQLQQQMIFDANIKQDSRILEAIKPISRLIQ